MRSNTDRCGVSRQHDRSARTRKAGGAPVILIGALALAGLAFGGCKRSATPPSSTPPASQPAATQPAGTDTGGQTLCPVGGEKIDLAVFTEYQGKRVYFCCEGCIEPFKKEPEKYVKKLPQLGGREEAGGGMKMDG